MSKLPISYQEATPQQKLRAYWPAFCDADTVPAEFAEDMEAAGLVELQGLSMRAAKQVVGSDPFWAAKFGEDLPSSIYVLTDAGRAALAEPSP